MNIIHDNTVMRFVLLILFLNISSCNNLSKESKNTRIHHTEESHNEDSLSIKGDELSEAELYIDTVFIDYLSNRVILDILPTLPDYTMSSWDWPVADREELVKFISENNYIVDSTERYLNIKYVYPNTIGLEVGDGFWTLSIYEIDLNKHIVITNDIVGDGNDINVFLKRKDILEKKSISDMLGNFIYEFQKDTNNHNCHKYLEDNFLTFYYSFKEKESVTVTSSYDENDSTDCLKGNTLIYKLNKQNEIFDLTDVMWTVN